jgi:hypothetical protein
MLVRKIDRNKWMNGDDVIEPIPADAITNCLRTKGNTLSVWKVNSERELEEAVLAIASSQDHLETIDVVWLDDDYFVKCKVNVEQTDGLTKIKDLAHTHRDLASLDLWTLGMVAQHVAESIKRNRIKRYTAASLKKILKDAVSKNRLNLSDLKDSVQKKMA